MWSLAQYTNTYQTTTSSSGPSALLLLIYLAFIVVTIVAYWKIFVKAGEAGWKSLIPIWNTIVLLRIVGYSWPYIFILIIPLVNIIFAIYLAYKLALSFGYGVGMTILEFVFGIGLLIIGFGDSKYLGPDGKGQKAQA